jgi:hypothetical protein
MRPEGRPVFLPEERGFLVGGGRGLWWYQGSTGAYRRLSEAPLRPLAYDADSEVLVVTPEEPTERGRRLHFYPLAARRKNRPVALGERTHTLDVEKLIGRRPRPARVTQVSPAGRWAVVGTSTETLALLALPSGQASPPPEGTGRLVGDDYWVTGTAATTLYSPPQGFSLYRLTDGDGLRAERVMTTEVAARWGPLCLLPDGEHLGRAELDGLTWLDLARGQRQRKLRLEDLDPEARTGEGGGRTFITDLSVTPDGQLLQVIEETAPRPFPPTDWPGLRSRPEPSPPGTRIHWVDLARGIWQESLHLEEAGGPVAVSPGGTYLVALGAAPVSRGWGAALEPTLRVYARPPTRPPR